MSQTTEVKTNLIFTIIHIIVPTLTLLSFDYQPFTPSLAFVTFCLISLIGYAGYSIYNWQQNQVNWMVFLTPFLIRWILDKTLRRLTIDHYLVLLGWSIVVLISIYATIANPGIRIFGVLILMVGTIKFNLFDYFHLLKMPA